MNPADNDNGVDEVLMRTACMMVAQNALERAGSGPVLSSTYVTKALEVPAQLYTPTVGTELEEAYREEALKGYPYLFHVRPAAVKPRYATLRATNVPLVSASLRLVVDCISALGGWQFICRVVRGRASQVDSVFSQLFDVDPFEELHLGEAEQLPTDLGRMLSPREIRAAVLNARFPLDPDSLSPDDLQLLIDLNNERIEQNEERIAKLKAGTFRELGISPIVLYDFSKHRAAIHLAALALLRKGRRGMAEVFRLTLEQFDTLLPLHRENLVQTLLQERRSSKRKVIQGLPDRVLPALEDLVRSGSEGLAPALAYWCYSEDVTPEVGLAMTPLAKKFSFSSSKQLEDALGERGQVAVPASCPACEAEGAYRVSRFAAASGQISFSFDCGACGHTEAHSRSAGWTKAVSHCPCPHCRADVAEALKVQVPPVIAALSEALDSVYGLAAEAFQVFDEFRDVPARLSSDEPSRSEYVPTTWKRLPEVRVLVDRESREEGVSLMFESLIRLYGDKKGYGLQEVVELVRGFDLRTTFYHEEHKRQSRSGRRPVVSHSTSINLLQAEKAYAPADKGVNGFLDALVEDGLLSTCTRELKPIELEPVVLDSIEVREPVPAGLPAKRGFIAVRRSFREQATLDFIWGAFLKTHTSAPELEVLYRQAYACAPALRERLLSRARQLPSPEVQMLLGKLAEANAVSASEVRNARDSLSKDSPDHKLLFCALYWNYTAPGLGIYENNALLSVSRMKSYAKAISEQWMMEYPVVLEMTCPRCRCAGAHFEFGGHNPGWSSYWKIACNECGHHEVPETGWNVEICECPGCLAVAREGLDGAPIGRLLERFITEVEEVTTGVVAQSVYPAFEADEALAAFPLLDHYNRFIDEGEEAGRRRVLEKLASTVEKCNAQWRVLKFQTATTLLTWLMHEYWRHLPPSALRRLYLHREGPPSDELMRDLKAFLDALKPYSERPPWVLALPLQVTDPGYQEKQGDS